MSTDETRLPLDTITFLRIRKWYLLALAAIAISIISAQVLIQRHLNSQLNDSRVINVAGKQRAYSQKLAKEVLLLRQYQDSDDRRKMRDTLEATLHIWKVSHKALLAGDDSLGIPAGQDDKIRELFTLLTPYHTAMVTATEGILNLSEIGSDTLQLQLDAYIATVLQNEGGFLNMMDTIVNEYDERSKEHLEDLKRKEYILLTISLAILLLEIFFIFRPLSVQVRDTISDLMARKKESEEYTDEIKKLFGEKRTLFTEAAGTQFCYR